VGKYVVDTNVGVIANGCGSATPECELACVQALRQVMAKGRISLDDNDLIFREYLRYLSLEGRPGVGDAYMRWVHDVRFDDAICTRVELTQVTSSETDFAEYPRDDGLSSLDRDDRKFVAVAASDPDRPTLMVGKDRGWDRHAAALLDAGITMAFLCGRA
jgi:hypothetical protein